jgi:Cu(I)/Ag(I) efflux system membrane fusion protein
MMGTTRKILIAVLVGAVFFLAPLAFAEMGSHSKKGNMHQDHHADMSDHSGAMNEVFEDYFAIQASLAMDSMEGVQARAKALAEKLEDRHGELMQGGEHGHGADMHVLTTQMADAARSLAEKDDISSAREEFGALSEELVEHHRNSDKTQSMKANIFKCDMAKKVWLQEDKETRNPYYGSSMLRCGRIIE